MFDIRHVMRIRLRESATAIWLDAYQRSRFSQRILKGSRKPINNQTHLIIILRNILVWLIVDINDEYNGSILEYAFGIIKAPF
ncbi:uncharacterized protein OCT59_013434 [Rhizophagus irregularis]|uniref:uncharacterized protein n=1 Tax=Rhizophagus irregularis TaxID=588596 RepID=UPI0033318002|nr:hypothetical protein OCT59_013434 [Rhizophagus irregularis]